MKMPRRYRVGHDGALVIVELDGEAFALTAESARALGKAILASAARADEIANVDRVVKDQALLIRAGVPISLTKNPRIVAEAKKEAETDRDLRRYLPHVPSSLSIGSPTIVQHAPKDKP